MAQAGRPGRAALAAALSVREKPGQPPVDGVIAALREQAALLILDNCEHLLDAVAQLAERCCGPVPG